MTSRGKCCDGGQDVVTLAFGDARGGLVQQQYARLGGDGDGDFQQPLLAIGQRRRQLVHDVEQMEARQDVGDLAVDVAARAHAPPPVAAAAEPFGDREPHRLQRRQVGIELVDLEGARQPAQHARVHGKARDVLAFEQDLAAIRHQHAGEQIDDGGLARPVGADQRVAGALLDFQREVARHLQAAERFLQVPGFEGDGHDASPSGTLTAVLRPVTCRITRLGSHSAQ